MQNRYEVGGALSVIGQSEKNDQLFAILHGYAHDVFLRSVTDRPWSEQRSQAQTLAKVESMYYVLCTLLPAPLASPQVAKGGRV